MSVLGPDSYSRVETLPDGSRILSTWATADSDDPVYVESLDQTYVATMDSEHFGWMAAGTTDLEARTALADGFRAHIVGAMHGEDEAREHLREQIMDAHDERDPLGADLPAVLDDWYGLRVVLLQAGECLRDGSPIAGRVAS